MPRRSRTAYSLGDSLSHDHHEVSSAAQPGSSDRFHEILFIIEFFFWHHDGCGSASHPHIQRQVASMATHDLHHRTTLMGLHGITELI